MITMIRTILASLALMSCPSLVLAQAVPKLVNYQGRLTKADGSSLPSGTYRIAFRIWNNQTNTSPTSLVWGREYDVGVVGGQFNIILGEASGISIPGAAVNDISYAFGDNERFLGVTIVRGTNGLPINSPSEVFPRSQILTVPYSIRSDTARIADSVVGGVVPRGAVIMWSGSVTNIPAGWALCDGKGGTPDLRNRFIVGADQDGDARPATSIDGTVRTVGGALRHAHSGNTARHSLSLAEIPSHSHRFLGQGVPEGGGLAMLGASLGPFRFGDGNEGGWHYSDANVIEAAGGGNGHLHAISEELVVPPFYALAFIIKL